MRIRCARLTPFVLAAIAGAAVSSQAEGTRVRLRGVARIEAQGVRAGGGDMLLRGVLEDDAGGPLSEGALTISIARVDRSAPGATGPSVATVPSAARGCTTDAHAPRVFTDGAHLVADAAGHFCVRLSVPVERYVAHVAYAGSEYVDSGSLDVPVDLSRRTSTLLFSPEPRIISLDAKTFSFDVAAMLEGDGVTSPGAGYTLTLSTERGASPVTTATTDAAGHARFALAPSELGPPGRGELRLGFAGNDDASAALRVARIERRAQVDLDVPNGTSSPSPRGGQHPGAQRKELASGSPEDGVTLTVTAHAAGGMVSNGSVEARVGEAIVGAAPIEGGTANLVVTFGLPESSGATGEVPIALRYVPSMPWYEPGPETTWLLRVRSRSPLRQAWLVLGGLAVAAWLVVTRVRRAKAMTRILARPRVASRGEAKLDIVRVARDASEGWKGRVTDADDASGIAAARVQIERPAFGRADVLASVVADADGRFELPAIERRLGDELGIEAPLHVALRRPLPPPGELDAQLVLRKRALLGRLVAWAKLRGRPFDARPEPTPGHVRHAAGDDFRVALWAAAVERAAFGGEPVDAHVEADVNRLAPGAQAVAGEPRAALDRRALANPTKANR